MFFQINAWYNSNKPLEVVPLWREYATVICLRNSLRSFLWQITVAYSLHRGTPSQGLLLKYTTALTARF